MRSYVSQPSLLIHSPANEELFTIKSNQLNEISIPLLYELSGDEMHSEKLNVCITLFRHNDGDFHSVTDIINIDTTLLEGNNILENECFEMKAKQSPPMSISKIKVGHYTLLTVFKKNTDYNNEIAEVLTKQSTVFTVKNYEDLVPTIFYHTLKEARFAANSVTEVSDEINIAYTFSNSIISLSDFEVCINLYDSEENPLINLNCLETTSSSIILKNLKIGKYRASLVLRGKSDGILFIEKTPKSSILFEVISLIDLLPSVKFFSENHNQGEFVSDHKTQLAEIISLTYSIEGVDSAVNQVVACVEIFSIDSNQQFIDQTCFPREHNMLTLKNVKQGNYLAKVVLRNQFNSSIIYPTTESIYKIIIKPSEEFIPTYEWQPLHAWHTIPSGIITRLPLSNAANKEARIPEPWKLQILMPSPCKYFLRMDLFKHVKISEIIDKASTQCKYPKECFAMYGNDILLSFDETVEESGFFSLKKIIEFNSSCID
eukprot:gene14660-19696_t